jgi:hypothetical protein
LIAQFGLADASYRAQMQKLAAEVWDFGVDKALYAAGALSR